MSKTREDYEALLRDYKGCPEGNELGVIAETLMFLVGIELDNREILRDIRSELRSSKDEKVEE